jgi:dsRNA-specific ribonuclease
MFKVQLHELCQQQRWALPVYTDRREGPPHAPRFQVTVVVNGAKFHTPEEGAGASKLKKAKDLAAMAALAALLPPPLPRRSPVGRRLLPINPFL